MECFVHEPIVVPLDGESPFGDSFTFDGAGVPQLPIDIIITCGQGNLTWRATRLYDEVPREDGIHPHGSRPFGPAVAYDDPALLSNMDPALMNLDTNGDGYVVVYVETHEGCKGVAGRLKKSRRTVEVTEDMIQMELIGVAGQRLAVHIATVTGRPTWVVTAYAQQIDVKTGSALVTPGPVVTSQVAASRL
jgi:hypothetical protein